MSLASCGSLKWRRTYTGLQSVGNLKITGIHNADARPHPASRTALAARPNPTRTRRITLEDARKAIEDAKRDMT